jgi:hypothetical protein
MDTRPINTRQLFNISHKLQNWSLFWILTLLCGYEGIIQYFQPKGFNAFKLLVASAMFIAFCLLVRMSWKRIKHRPSFSKFFLCYYFIYIAYCLITVMRSMEPDIQVIANLLGSYTTGLGLLVPLIAVVSDQVINHDILLRTGMKLIGVGILLTPLGLAEGRLALFASPFIQLSYLLLPFWLYLNKKQRQLLIVGLIACLFVSLFTNVRSMLMREFLIIGCFLVFHTLRKKSIMAIITVALALFTILTLSTFWGDIISMLSQREIDVFGIKIDNDQNRAWMYDEVYADLNNKSDLLFGRGGLGKYFSEFFYSVYTSEGTSADEYNRYNIEVGVLSYLLKGGYILVLSTLILLITAGFLGLTKAKSTFVTGLGIVVVCHVIGMFVENYPKLASYDLIIWMYAGACLSTTMRASNDPFQSFRPPVRLQRTFHIEATQDHLITI